MFDFMIISAYLVTILVVLYTIIDLKGIFKEDLLILKLNKILKKINKKNKIIEIGKEDK